MREILFRGKCKDTGEWRKGFYINLHKTTYCFKEDYEANKDNDVHQIVFEEMTDWGLPNQYFRVDVIPETIGQYTGLIDKNGTKIFEGDIVKIGGDNLPYWMEVGKFKPVEYINDGFCPFTEYDNDCGTWLMAKDCEVIGNIHDNPELVKEREG